MNLDSKNARKQLAALKIMDEEMHSEQLGLPHPKYHFLFCECSKQGLMHHLDGRLTSGNLACAEKDLF